jgi:hypothetical protein
MNAKELAKQAGIEGIAGPIKAIEHFAELVAAHEREQCAKVCDEVSESRGDADECATEIRARSKA